jgi:ADP-heptose:LPS heptosyltransferase
MGSAIIAHSALTRVKTLFPDAVPYFLIFKKNRESVDLLNTIPFENVLTISDRSFLEFTVSAARMLLHIRSLKIDTVVDMELFSRFTTIFSFLTGAKRRVGYHNYTAEGLYRGNLISHRVFYNPHQHMAYNFIALVHALEADQAEAPLLKKDVRPMLQPLPRFDPTPAEEHDMRALVKELFPQFCAETELIIFNPDPGDALPIRGWPMNRFEELARRILDANPRAVIGVVGLGRSKSYAETLQQATAGNGRDGRCLDLTGRTKSLRELLAILTFSKMLVTNDSGPAHMAMLTDVKVVTLFGPETPALYGPLGPNATNIFAHFSCSPCLSAANHRHTVCTNSRCLQAISVDEVYRATTAALPVVYR